jgi:amino acid adenylation domain-containing protein
MDDQQIEEKKPAAAGASLKPRGIPRRAPGDSQPLSFAQQRLWFLDQLEPGSTAYNVPVLLRVQCVLDVRSLIRSLEEIVRRHEALRTVFPALNGQPVQQVLPPFPIEPGGEDLRSLPADVREQHGLERATAEARKTFDLARGPLFRVHLWRLGEDVHLLLLTIHHIACDGWSVGILLRELASLYEAFAGGLPSPLPELEIQYADFAEWQRKFLQGDTLNKQLAYWKKQLQGVPPLLDLPLDHPRLAVQSMRGRWHDIAIPPALADELKRLSRKENVTVFMTLLAAFQTLLYRYSAQQDFLVAVPIAGRVRVETEGIVGFFVNTLPLRADFSDDPTFAGVLKRIRAASLGSFDHQDLPFEKLVEELRPERTLSHHPLVQVMFAYENAPMPAMGKSGLKLTPLRVESERVKFDLSLTVYEENGFSGYLEYASDLFDAGTIGRMDGHFQTLLRGIAANPQERVSRLPLLTEPERRVLRPPSPPATVASGHPTVHGLIELQATQTPDANALVGGNILMSYRDLNTKANQLAHTLRACGVGKEVIVGLCMDRSPEMVVALLAILKSGGAYLPLDPEYPKERIDFIMRETRAPVLLTHSSLLDRLPALETRLLAVDTAAASIGRESPENPGVSVAPGDLAYVIYTSGSTGTPKGVEIPHGAIAAHCIECRGIYALGPDDRVLQFSSLSADVSLEQILPTLVSGSTLVIRDQEIWNPVEFLRKLKEQRLTVVNIPTAYWHHLAQEWAESPDAVATHELRLMIVGGEAMLPESLSLWQHTPMNRVRLLNAYGPTEVTITATTYEIPPRLPGGESPGRIPIGTPLGGRTAYILDGNLQPVPSGIAGELFFGGADIARGYLNRPALTAEAFVPDPFNDAAGAKMYRTGDLARFLPDGNIEFLGRKDDQVKIRGFRIELGEVETVLTRYPDVREGVVVARREAAGGENHLVAYVVWRNSAQGDSAGLRSFMQEHLPEYMVPGIILPLAGLPITPTGKVDRKALPPPDGAQARRAFMAPRDPLEKQLANLWEKIFNARPIGVRDNFFELGGHSLLAVRLFSQVEKMTGKNLPLVTLFQAPTIELLAGILRQKGWEPHWSSLVPIKPGGSKSPFYCVHGVGGNILEFEHFSRYFDPDRPLYGIQAQGLDGKRPRHRSVEEMAAHYVGEIREFQPEGPYYLGGSSFGGLVAYEIAQRLVAAGQAVGILAMFDTNAPGYPKYLPAITSFRRRLNHVRFRAELHWSNIRAAKGPLRREYISAKAGRFVRQYRVKTWRKIQAVGKKVERLLLPRAIREVNKGGHQANRTYEPVPYPGKVTLFRATEQPYGIEPDATNGWSTYAAGGVEIHDIPGHHGAIVREPRAGTLVRALAACLDAAADARAVMAAIERKETRRGR